MTTTLLIQKHAMMLPRVIRFRHAPVYLGMDRNRFNRIVRPFITEIPIGKQGIAFDRLELDRWADQYIQSNGRPGKTSGDELWDEKSPQGSLTEMESGTSTNGSVGNVFAKAVQQIRSQRQKRS